MKRLLQVLMAAAGFAMLSLPAHAVLHFSAVMSGLNEIPTNASPATGFTSVTLAGDDLTVDVEWDGLIGGNPAAAHIHCCAVPHTVNAPVAVGFTGFPATTSGTYHHVFDLTSIAIYGAGYLAAHGGTAAGAEAALIAGLDAGTAYSNIHNATFTGGEIRGLLVGVPEPATIAILGLGLMTLPFARRRKQKRP